MFVSATRLRLRSFRFLPGFLLRSGRVNRQLGQAPGFHGGALLTDRRLTFWTLTGWADEQAMRAFMTADAHRAVMPRLLDWCDQASVVHWQGATALPGWDEVDARMRREGRASRVKRPHVDHAGLRFLPPRPWLATPLRSRRAARG